MSCIFVAEDDRVVRDVVSDALVDAGYEELRCIPVAIMSAVPALRQAAVEQGVQVTVGKRFAVDALLAQIECLLSEVPSRDH